MSTENWKVTLEKDESGDTVVNLPAELLDELHWKIGDDIDVISSPCKIQLVNLSLQHRQLEQSADELNTEEGLKRLGDDAYRESKKVEFTSLADISRKYPRAVICLLSALRFHNLTTQAPHEVWAAMPNKVRIPDYPPLRTVRFSGKALTEGIETHQVEGVDVKITCVAKTVADCFKYRNKIGLDVALEALTEAWRDKRITMDELWHYAGVCRVTSIIRPYLEYLGHL